MYGITRVNLAALHVLSIRASPLRALLTDQWVSTLTEGDNRSMEPSFGWNDR